MYSSAFTRMMFRSWSVPMNEPMKTRLSVVVIRIVVVSRDLSTVIDGRVLFRVLSGDIDGEAMWKKMICVDEAKAKTTAVN